MTRLSSRITIFLKVLFPALGILGCGVGMAVTFLRPESNIWQFFSGGLIASCIVSLFGLSVKDVRFDGKELVISNFLKTARVPASQIARFDNILHRRSVYVYFKHKTPFGRKVKFFRDSDPLPIDLRMIGIETLKPRQQQTDSQNTRPKTLIAKINAFVRSTKTSLGNYPREWIELCEEGFYLKTERWPFRPHEKRIRWDSIREIHACIYDCYSCHNLALYFTFSNGKPVIVYERREGWQALVNEVAGRFPGFNTHNLGQVEKCFPGEACFPCWHFEKPIGNLNANMAERTIVWEEDGSDFYRDEDE